jgi:hypothetical protein
MAQSSFYSRRKLLCGLGLGGVGMATSSWAAPIAGALSKVVPRVTASVRQTGMADWTAAIGASFIVRGESGAAPVKLVAVTPLASSGRRPAGLRSGAFAATFQGTDSRLFPAGNRTYVFQQGNGSQMQLFVSAKSLLGGKAQLIAILN